MFREKFKWNAILLRHEWSFCLFTYLFIYLFIQKFMLCIFRLALLYGKNNRLPFLDILGYLKIPTKIANLEEWDKSQSGNLVGNSLVGTCLTLPNLGFLWVFFKYSLKYPILGICYFFLCLTSTTPNTPTKRGLLVEGVGLGHLQLQNFSVRRVYCILTAKIYIFL